MARSPRRPPTCSGAVPSVGNIHEKRPIPQARDRYNWERRKLVPVSSGSYTAGMVDRLRRLDRIFDRAPVYFVTACTYERRPILAEASVHACLLQFAHKGADQGAWLGAFVLMPDHLHVFIALEEDSDPAAVGPLQLGNWMKALKRTVSQAFRNAGVESPHWQKGFFDHLLRSEESYAEKWEYVRQNPVRAGLVARPEDWPYFAQPFPLEYRRGG